MGFKIFLLVMILIVPAIMVGFGAYFMKRAPKKINYVFGYRTARSMKNRDTWQFAHNFIGKLWLVCGALLLVVGTVSFFVFTANKNENAVNIASLVILGVQLLVLTCSIIPTESALKKTFDENGNKKNNRTFNPSRQSFAAGFQYTKNAD
ncbi:MAG TPA: hypothetical protein DDY77_04480 [Clostridiales bacterium]|nr:hypothetical protein [Clostridiales bacterium]